jgi:hypothetical protein
MKMKTLISITTAVVMFICLSTAPAHADRKTTEGFLLGIGAAVLGTAIYQGLNQSSGYREPQRYHAPPPAYGHKPQCRNDRRYGRQPVVRWEIRRIWVEPAFETRWNPGHYNRKGHWVGGRHEKIKVRDGYWKERRVRGRH